MGKEFQKSALPTLFHFVRVKAAFQPHVIRIILKKHSTFAAAVSNSSSKKNFDPHQQRQNNIATTPNGGQDKSPNSSLGQEHSS